MEIQNFLRYFTVITITLIVSSLLTKLLNRATPKDINDTKIMEMPIIYLILSNILFFFFLLIEYTVFLNETLEFHIYEKFIFCFFGLFLGFGGINTILLYIRHKIIYDNNIIIQTNWLGKTESISWQEIEKISFSLIKSSLIIENYKKKIMVHEHMKGYKTFVTLLESKTNLKLNK